LVSSPIVIDEYSSNINLPNNISYSKLSSVPFPLRQSSQDPSIVNSCYVASFSQNNSQFFPQAIDSFGQIIPHQFSFPNSAYRANFHNGDVDSSKGSVLRNDLMGPGPHNNNINHCVTSNTELSKFFNKNSNA